jgi:hypothetical protein
LKSSENLLLTNFLFLSSLQRKILKSPPISKGCLMLAHIFSSSDRNWSLYSSCTGP